MNSIDLKKVTYFIVTGASRGIGQKMAIECSKHFKEGSIVMLLARSIDGLNVTKSKILENNPSINVLTYTIDLNNPSNEEIEACINKSLINTDTSKFELTFIIHNAGTLGDPSKKASQLSKSDDWQNYFSTNVFTVAKLNSHFMATFSNNKKLIVNITSKACLVPFKSFTYYCTGKAAREMYFKVLAEEEPDCIVLNYSPGPVDTDMTRNDVMKSHDTDILNFYNSIRDKKSMLTVDQTTQKFIEVLSQGTFKTGDHVDYYD